LTTITALPMNSIFFGTDNGYYVPDTLHRKMITCGLIPVVNRGNGTDLDMEEERIKHLMLQESIMASKDRIAKLRMEIEREGKSLEKFKGETERAATQMELEKMRAALKFAEELQGEEELAEQAELAALMDVSDVRQHMVDCEELVASIKAMNESYVTQKNCMLKAQFLLEARQIKLLSELQSIFPIERLENGEHCIRGVELPMDTSQKDDDQISTALGYVVHVLLLASKYLEVPLRYQLMFYASRSMIRDPVQANSSALPLFRRGTERERFDRAIVWLKRDIEQLLLTRGIPYEPSRCILFNINKVFEHEMCPTLAL